MNLKRSLLTLGILLTTLPLYDCKKDGGGINIFSIADDKKFGQQTVAEIESDPTNYPIVSESAYPAAYGHIQRITDNIINAKDDKGNYLVSHREDFEWKVKLINQNVLNAFCTPGGYIYVYTGLINYLDTEDQLAGVMGHEIAHAANRHSTDQLTRDQGIQFMFDIVLGKQSALNGIGQKLIGLQYSKKAESQADEYSVIYLAKSPYQCNGAGGFFTKLIESGQGGCNALTGFLSTHPCPDNRVQAIDAKATSISCSKTTYTGTTYAYFKNSLPASYQ